MSELNSRSVITDLAISLVFFTRLPLPPFDMPGRKLALAATMIVTGCLHEDGLADTADAFGGGRSIERKLEIMRDSRIGTYGAAALVLSVLLRWASLASLPGGASAVCALIAAHAASRGILPILMQRTPAARDSGLAASAGSIADATALVALAIGAIPLLLLGIVQGLLLAILTGVFAWWLRGLFIRQIGGLTGDTMGAAQQIVEITILVAAGAILS